MLTGFLIPSSGFVSIQNKDLFSDPIEVKKLIGYLPEAPPLYEDLTVEEYLSFVSKIKGISSLEIFSEIDRVTSKTNITDKLKITISKLSLGYRKRVGIAQALLGKPPIIIMDEPISGLDPKQIVEIRNLIKELSGEHTVLLSSHILSEVQKTCDRFLFIREGKLLLDLNQEDLEKEIDSNSSTLLGLSGKLEDCIHLLNSLENLIEYKKISEDHKGYTFQVDGLNHTKNKETLLDKIQQTKGVELLSMNKQDLKLEDIFDRL
jgi:ABC-2 type transport system ATP-binding protein